MFALVISKSKLCNWNSCLECFKGIQMEVNISLKATVLDAVSDGDMIGSFLVEVSDPNFCVG